MILNIRNGRKPRKPSPPTTKNSDDLEKKVKDVVKVEGSIIAFSLLALGLVLNAISTYDQLNFALAQVPGGRFFGFIPLGPIMQTFTVIVLFDVACLSTGLVSRIAPGKHYDLKYGLIVFSVCSLVIGLVLFTWAVWSLRLAFFY
jgi:archaellum biogenesis protein FlaJ (TadC family)